MILQKVSRSKILQRPGFPVKKAVIPGKNRKTDIF
jgi:hypothetical protein